MKLTKEERFIAYCILKEEAISNRKIFIKHHWLASTGLCSLIYRILELDLDLTSKNLSKIDIFLPRHVKEVFPELWKNRPKKLFSDSYWFTPTAYGWQQRINLLDKCIKLTES